MNSKQKNFKSWALWTMSSAVVLAQFNPWIKLPKIELLEIIHSSRAWLDAPIQRLKRTQRTWRRSRGHRGVMWIVPLSYWLRLLLRYLTSSGKSIIGCKSIRRRKWRSRCLSLSRPSKSMWQTSHPSWVMFFASRQCSSEETETS